MNRDLLAGIWTPRRDGMVMLLALLCLIALQVTAAGVHFLALQEIRTARSAQRLLEMRVAAQSAANVTLRDWPSWLDTLTLLEPRIVSGSTGVTATGITFSASVERTQSDLFLVRASAVSPLRERTGVAVIAASIPAAAAAAAAKGALMTAGVVTIGPGGSVAAGGGSCTSDSIAAVVAGDTTSVLRTGGTIDGPMIELAQVDLSRIGALTPARILSVSRPLPSVISPAPAATGTACSTQDAANWGDPTGTVAACAHYRPVLSRDGDLLVSGGVGQGILVTTGNLTMSGTRFDGIVFVGGSLSLLDGASLRGVVLLPHGPATIAGASITLDRCAVSESAADPALRGPARTAGRMWIPHF